MKNKDIPAMDIFCLESLLLFFLLPLIIIFTFNFYSKRWNTKGFKQHPLIGSLPEFILNRHRLTDWTTQVLADCPTNTSVFYRPGKVHGIITANPLNVEHILKTNFENYPKGDIFIMLLHDFLGRGIFNADGDIWKLQRKTASYEFNTKSLRTFIMDNAKTETTTRLVPLLTKSSGTDQTLDLQDVLERFAFDNICRLAFNIDPGVLGNDTSSGSEFMRAFEYAALASSERFMYIMPLFWRFKKYFNIGSERKLKESIAIVHKFADDIINSRLKDRTAEIKKDEDLLSRFIGTEENSPDFLRDIIISFILAGRDTTSSALTWFFWQLSLNPSVEKNIVAEVETIRTRNGKKPGDTYKLEELREMHYLHAAITEALRLYPPVPMDTKESLNDDVLPDGTIVRKGWFITYHTYAMGRIEGIWGKNCHIFLPERWLENGVCRQESPFRFPVFHAGPRMCLGKDMAYIQMKSLAATIIERFVVEIPNKHICPEQMLSLTLRMKGGLHVKMKKRYPENM